MLIFHVFHGGNSQKSNKKTFESKIQTYFCCKFFKTTFINVISSQQRAKKLLKNQTIQISKRYKKPKIKNIDEKMLRLSLKGKKNGPRKTANKKITCLSATHVRMVQNVPMTRGGVNGTVCLQEAKLMTSIWLHPRWISPCEDVTLLQGSELQMLTQACDQRVTSSGNRGK